VLKYFYFFRIHQDIKRIKTDQDIIKTGRNRKAKGAIRTNNEEIDEGLELSIKMKEN
jgi:hypothetical protein